MNKKIATAIEKYAHKPNNLGAYDGKLILLYEMGLGFLGFTGFVITDKAIYVCQDTKKRSVYLKDIVSIYRSTGSETIRLNGEVRIKGTDKAKMKVIASCLVRYCCGIHGVEVPDLTGGIDWKLSSN